jgi:hypothetical protein
LIWIKAEHRIFWTPQGPLAEARPVTPIPNRGIPVGRIKFTSPDGKLGERDVKAGQSVWNLAGKHHPENLGDRPFEVVLIEMKTK